MEHNTKVFPLSFLRVIALLIHYFLGYLYVYPIVFSKITLCLDPQATMILPFLQIVAYVFSIIIAVYLAWPLITYGCLKFTQNKRYYMKLIGLFMIMILCANVLLSVVVSFFTTTTTSKNQEVIREASNIIPMITLFSSCIAAPLLEELVFRAGVFGWIRKKVSFWIAAILSSFLFASIHFTETLFTGNLSDIAYIVVYAGLGMILSYSYEKSDTIVVPFGIHLLNNAITMFIMFL